MDESSSSRQIKIGAILGYINYALKMGVQLAYVPILLSFLGQSEYGVYQLAGSMISYLSLLSFGFGGAYYRFYSQCRGDTRKEAGLNGTYLITFLFFALLSGVAGTYLTVNSEWILGSKLTPEELVLAKKLLAVLMVNLVVSFPSSVFSAIVFSRECFIFQRIVEIIKTVLNPALVIFLLLLGYGSMGVVLVSTFLTVASFALNIWYVLVRIKTPFSFRDFNLKLVGEIGAFSVFLFLDAIIDQINWNVDKFLLGRLVGTISIAIYSIGAQINTIYIQLTDMLATICAPRINHIVANEQNPMPHLNAMLIQIGRIQAMIIFAVICGFVILGKEFIALWAGEGYEEAYYVTLLLIVPNSLPLSQSAAVDIQRALNKHQLRSMIFAGTTVLNLFISIPLIRIFGAAGAAMGTAGAVLLGDGLIMNLLYQKWLGLDVLSFWKSVLALIPAAIPASICSMLLKQYFPVTSLWMLILHIGFFMVIYCGCLLLYGMTRQEKETVYQFLRRGD
ncbi:MAG: oligosaccharide flippase family protein [Oscillospiraceae bacterium]